jgi:ribosomal protein S11
MFLTKSQEENLYSKLPTKIRKMEKRMFYSKEFYLNRSRPLLSKLHPKYAKLYISNKRKNTFTSVSQSFTEKRFDRSFKLIFKASSGGNGFKGPKKSTVFARQDVIKSASNFINNNYFTSTDIIFNTKAPRRGRKHLRTMFNNLIYIRSIKMTARRAHGYVRKPKQKRK